MGEEGYFPSFTMSAIFSPIIMTVRLVLARVMAGMTDASTTRSP